MEPGPTIFVVDDTEAARRALLRLLESAGLTAEAYGSAGAFLAAYDGTRSGCVLLDIRMPGMTGLELQEELVRRNHRIPVIIVSAHSEVENVVRAIKTGAVDFLKKPYRAQVLIARIQQALALDGRNRQEDAARAAVVARLDVLTPREREVMDLLVTGLSAKEIARRLGLSRTTVDIHRGHLMAKLAANSVVELVELARRCGCPASSGAPASTEPESGR